MKMTTHNIRVYGIVQGVGFRPFVSRTAEEYGIRGTVSNRGSYVEIMAQGDVDSLIYALRNRAPERSIILNIIQKTCEHEAYDGFEIIDSSRDEGDIFVSPDIGICDKCARELYDRNDRRYMHPFINCTNCGPRLTILDAMPYDRERTSMKDFEMCPECEYEYTHSESRRYDAQPVCCPNCGPVVYAYDPKAHRNGLPSIEAENSRDLGLLIGREAIISVRQAIRDGRIVAVKGIGGYHLCCDATSVQAVSRLRELKHRPMKPFAVMMKDMSVVERECVLDDISDEIREYLTGYQRPIVLLEERPGTKIASSVSPDNPSVGVMLPYTPLHMLLFDYEGDTSVSDCLVMTSANASGAPICRTDEDAINEIVDFTDIVLSNNRTIRTRADDSVMDCYNGRPYIIRRSRGFAPLPVMIESDMTGSVLGIGGELKNTFCIAKNNLYYPSAYVGDMADIRTVAALKESVARMIELLEARPELVVADMHPKYNTTAVAEELGLPVMKVQHHYAHILSCMAENGYLDEVLGVSFDGTGYGTDGTIWGGEFLRCRLDGFDRLGSITPFIQSGGDLSSREGWRVAAAILRDSVQDGDKLCQRLGICSEMEYNMLAQMADMDVNSIVSTSAGRLFDAASAVLGIRRHSTFEGEASTALMYEAMRYRSHSQDSFSMMNIKEAEMNTSRIVADIASDRLEGRDPGELAYIFHQRLAEMICSRVITLSEETGLRTVALSGGVFQNKLLLELVEFGLRDMKILRHSLIPTNDGGIALGQALAGMYRVNTM